MRKLTTVMLIVFLIFIAGCASKQGGNVQPSSKEADGPGVTATSIKIGAWLPLTGAQGAYGTIQKIGPEAYFKMVNDKGGVNGRKIDWVAVDTAFDPQKTVAAAMKLSEQDKVFAMVAPNGTAPTAATFSYLLDQVKIPIINNNGGALDWWNPVKPNLYGVQVPYEDQAKVVGQWIAKDGFKNILVVHSDLGAFTNVAKNVEPGVAMLDVSAKVKLMPVKYNTIDYVPVVLQVANAKPDAVVIILAAGEAVAFAKELARQNVKLPLYSYCVNVSNDIISLGGAAMEGMKAVSWTVPPDGDSPALKEYQQAIKTLSPNNKTDFQSLYTYATAKVFVEALSRVKGPLTRENFIIALETIKNYETGILPPVTYSATKHNGTTELQRVQIQNGAWKTIGSFVDPNSKW